MSSRYRSLLALLGVLMIALGLYACAANTQPASAPGAAPTAAVMPTATLSIILPPVAPSATAPALLEPAPALLESRRLTLEFPQKIRVGDSDILRLTLEVDDLGGLTPTMEVAGHTVTGETVQIPNLYDTHKVLAESRLDLAGMLVEPSGVQTDQLLPGQPVTFRWSLYPLEAGRYRGVVRLNLRFLPFAGGAESQQTVSAQMVEIQAVKFLGLSGGPARIIGMLGSGLATVLGFPFLEDILRWLWRRSRLRSNR